MFAEGLRLMKKGIGTLRREGLNSLITRTIRWGYPKFRRYLDTEPRIYEYNGIPSRSPDYHWLDSYVPRYRPKWYLQNVPEYESELIDSIDSTVGPGDTVTVVGGGFGITAVNAARRVGPTGHVSVFEGAADCVDRIKDTIRLNGVSDRVSVNHAIVGTAIELRGSPEGAETYAVSDLPDCDVLELDCEGAELEIIRNLERQPRHIIAETHGIFESPTNEVISALEGHGYTLTRKETLNPQEGVDVVVASRK